MERRGCAAPSRTASAATAQALRVAASATGGSKDTLTVLSSSSSSSLAFCSCKWERPWRRPRRPRRASTRPRGTPQPQHPCCRTRLQPNWSPRAAGGASCAASSARAAPPPRRSRGRRPWVLPSRALARVARRAALDERLPHVRQRVIVQCEEPVLASDVDRRVGTRLLLVEAQRRRGRAQLRRQALAYACTWPKGCRMTQEHRCDDELHRLLRQSVPAPSIDATMPCQQLFVATIIFELAACKALENPQHAAAIFATLTQHKAC